MVFYLLSLRFISTPQVTYDNNELSNSSARIPNDTFKFHVVVASRNLTISSQALVVKLVATCSLEVRFPTVDGQPVSLINKGGVLYSIS